MTYPEKKKVLRLIYSQKYNEPFNSQSNQGRISPYNIK